MSKKCSYCLTNPIIGYCKDCKISGYCSRECQVKSWKLHKTLCANLVESKKTEDSRMAAIYKYKRKLKAFCREQHATSLNCVISTIGKLHVMDVRAVRDENVSDSLYLHIMDQTINKKITVRLCKMPTRADTRDTGENLLSLPLTY